MDSARLKNGSIKKNNAVCTNILISIQANRCPGRLKKIRQLRRGNAAISPRVRTEFHVHIGLQKNGLLPP